MRLSAVFGICLGLLITMSPSCWATAGDPGKLLQFTSAGHVLGFEPSAVLVASGDHMLKVELAEGRLVSPTSEEQGAGQPVNAGSRPLPLTRVTYHQVWDGVTVVYEKCPNGIVKSTYHVAAGGGGDPSDQIRLRYNRPVRLASNGNLVIPYQTGDLIEQAPVAWQEVAGERKPIPVSYVVRGDGEVGFNVQGYDPDFPLVIDPVLTWNTFLGGSGTDYGRSIAVDSSGNVYVGGDSSATWGAPVRAYTSGRDAFAAKLASDGSLTWNTFLGGSGTDLGFSIAVDGSGNVYVGGFGDATWGQPVRPYTSDYDAFAAKLIPVIPPTVTTQVVSNIGTTTATGNGNITDLGTPNPTQHGVCWSTSANPTVALPTKTEQGAKGTTGAFTSNITGLSPNTTYHVRAYATNTAGTAYGGDVSFTTSAQAPTVTTQAVNGIGPTTATGNGNITDLGTPDPTAHGVCWNTTGNPTLADPYKDNGAASSTGAFTAAISGLTGGTTYYVRAFVTNDAGTAYGDEVNFKTKVALTMAVSPAAGGTTTPAAESTTNLDAGAGQSITATAATGYHFVNWTAEPAGNATFGNAVSASTTVTLIGSATVTANFAINTYTLTAAANPAGGGTVTRNPDKTNYEHGESVQVTATANPGYAFTGWSGDLSGTTNPATLTMDTNKTITANFGLIQTLATGTPASYKVTVTKVEMFFNASTWTTIFSGSAQLDMAAGGTFPGIGDVELPSGIYSELRVTFNNAFPVSGTAAYSGTPYYTTATPFSGQANLASTPTTVPGSMAAFTFRNPAWGALNADVTRTFTITPMFVSDTTNYQPTLRFTISNTLLLRGTAGNTSTYYFSIDAPTVSLVEP